jgi:HK97 family phage major capsid protein
MKLNIAGLRAKRGQTIEAMTALTEGGEFKAEEFNKLETEVTNLDVQIKAMERAAALSRSLARPTDGPQSETDEIEQDLRRPSMERSLTDILNESRSSIRLQSRNSVPEFNTYLRVARNGLGFRPEKEKHWNSLGEQMHAIARHYLSKGDNSDPRLIRAPTGAGEVDPTGGGFLVQTDFASAIFMLAHDMGDIISRVNKIPISATSNALKINGIDETSRATGSRWGGVQSYWLGEGGSVTATKPKFRQILFDLKKLMSVMYMTDELLQDSTALTAIAGQAFSEEIMFMTEDAIWEGSGAGMPLGLINSPAVISVAKETGQKAATIVKENLDNMWSRMWVRSRANSVWTINQEIEPQLLGLNQAVGTGGQMVYLPPGGMSAAPYATLYGRPVIATEYNAALGSVGDIGLVDLSQYTLVDKNGIQAATSMHVAFLTDEMVFRVTYRVDGQPMWHSAITPFKGSTTKSPFITLAAR